MLLLFEVRSYAAPEAHHLVRCCLNMPLMRSIVCSLWRDVSNLFQAGQTHVLVYDVVVV